MEQKYKQIIGQDGEVYNLVPAAAEDMAVEEVDEQQFPTPPVIDNDVEYVKPIGPTPTTVVMVVSICIAILIGAIVIIAVNNNNKDEQLQSAPDTKQTAEPETNEIAEPEEKEPDVPTEYLNALEQAYQYGETMNMSKKGIYDQLTSDYGGQFDKDAAQYAVDNVKIDWNANAVVQAKTYSETMSMSKKAVYNQLISEYGGQFTKKQAKYGVEHMND